MSSSSSAPPSSASAAPSSAPSSPPSSAPSAPPSSAPPSSASSAPPSTSASVSPSSTPSAPSSPSVSLIRSTDASGIVVTVTSTKPFTPVGPTNPSQTGGAAATGNKGFFENKAAVGATFGIVGVVALGIIFMLVTGALRRRRARAFDREAEEEAKRAPPPVFMDDDEDGYGGVGGYSAYGAAAGGHNADHYGQEQYAAADYPLGYSDVSSQGTYAQQPMEAQYGGGGGGYGAAAAYGGAAAAAGAYEMTGYGHGGHQGGYGAAQQHDWAAVQPQTGYVYPGEEQGYPPAPSNDSETLARSKSYGTGSPAPSAAAATQVPSYADGYAAQYQTPHIVEGEDEGYGGMHRSEHGHVEYPYDDEDDGRPKILKVANE